MQVTLCGLFLGIIAACLSTKIGWGYQVGAALCLELSHVLDCVDGELARLTGRGNPFAAAMDPITDRLKDIALLLAAFVYCSTKLPFGLAIDMLAALAILTTGLWLLYMYIVDAYLNPARKIRGSSNNRLPRLYLGFYDLFIYGCIALWLTNCFDFFLFYVLALAVIGNLIQIYRLRDLLMPT